MFRTRTPLSKIRRSSTARLACVRPPASVHPEPGSNSPLYVCSLAHSKLLTLWFFLTFFLVVICMSMISLLFALFPVTSSVVGRLNCECKSINYFLNDQIFLKKILSPDIHCVIQQTPSLTYLSFQIWPLSLSCASPLSLPRIGIAKVQLIFKLPNVFW